ncbi:MAG: ribonuclease III [Firmicutes bacterium]|nr:ribonuclease III [Bacillota bacterium]
MSLETRLGYQFQDRRWLEQALTHPSSGIHPDNQRLEYLGDALFGAALSTLLFEEKPDWPEGSLTKLRHFLVSTESLHQWARDLELRLKLPGKSDPSHLKTAFRKPLADAVEALLAAVYLDAGSEGFAEVRRLVANRFREKVRETGLDAWQQHDTKTTLQERAASLGLPAPAYELRERRGPDHAPHFVVQVRVGPHQAEASARTLKQAQIEAARQVLPKLI